MNTDVQPIRIEPLNPSEMLIAWNTGESFALPFLDLRFQCPCAACVDEHTGKRILKRENLDPAVRPLSANPVGRYAIQINWSDQHVTGMYHFENLYKICGIYGRKP